MLLSETIIPWYSGACLYTFSSEVVQVSQQSRVIIVGAGISGLTAATSLAMRGHKVLVLEKHETCGCLVNSFVREGFLFDGGIREVKNAGMVKPMLKELYPESKTDVEKVIKVIAKFDVYMQVLFGSDSPFFKDAKRDIRYYLSTFIVWCARFLATGAAILRMRLPMEQFLGQLLENQSLRDIISQHFFKKTPAFFAMSYFSLYPDYHYPKGGVGSIPKALAQRLAELGSEVRTKTEVVSVDAYHKTLTDGDGNHYSYDKLIWCADLKGLYSSLLYEGFSTKETGAMLREQKRILNSRGAESVFTLFLAVDLPPSYFSGISEGHFFYTPSKNGLGELHRADLAGLLSDWDTLDRERFYTWLEAFCRLNTYEISIPVLNDGSAAPEGKTGLIISFLFDYELTRRIEEDGWYDQFEKRITELMITSLSESVYPTLNEHILFSFTASPLSIHRKFACSEGAIVGWSFEQEIPIEAGMLNMKKAITTPLPDIYRAGQWTVSPAGLPTCIMTAKMAADLVHAKLSD